MSLVILDKFKVSDDFQPNRQRIEGRSILDSTVKVLFVNAKKRYTSCMGTNSCSNNSITSCVVHSAESSSNIQLVCNVRIANILATRSATGK